MKAFEPKSPTSPASYHKAGKMELAHVPSDHARSIIINASGAGDTGSKTSNNKTGGGNVGKSKGGQRYAGNINTGR